MVFKKSILLFLLITTINISCSTIPQQKEKKETKAKETPKDIETAVGSVVNTISGKKMRVKYCSLCGKHYSYNLQSCPNDGTILKEIEE